MTNEEAVTILEKYMFLNEDDELYTEAVKIAIKAIEECEEWDKLRCICASEGVYVYKIKETDNEKDTNTI